VYFPFTMMPFDGFNVVVRTRGDPVTVLHSIREDVQSVDPGQAEGDLTTAADLLEGDSLGRERFVARLFSGFALLGLAFAVSGLYGIQSYLVAQRKRELGLRIALGAQRTHILDEVTRRAGLSVLAGTVIGIVLNLALSQLFAHWTNGNARDPVMLVVIVGLLLLAAALASLGPALAATSIAPADALRAE
jgi:ABC-type antimicrobial peptide transport system permease subunit